MSKVIVVKCDVCGKVCQRNEGIESAVIRVMYACEIDEMFNDDMCLECHGRIVTAIKETIREIKEMKEAETV